MLITYARNAYQKNRQGLTEESVSPWRSPSEPLAVTHQSNFWNTGFRCITKPLKELLQPTNAQPFSRVGVALDLSRWRTPIETSWLIRNEMAAPKNDRQRQRKDSAHLWRSPFRNLSLLEEVRRSSQTFEGIRSNAPPTSKRTMITVFYKNLNTNGV
jgi:hypothetical protein